MPAATGAPSRVPSPPSVDLRSPQTLHPALWLGHQLGRTQAHAVSSGFAALDAELPGGGWPRRVLSELLLPHLGIGEVRLLAPPLVAAQRAGRLVMIFDPPAALSAPALAWLGFDVGALLVVNTRARVIPAATAFGRSSRRSRAAMSAPCWPGCRRACAPSECAGCSSPRMRTTASLS